MPKRIEYKKWEEVGPYKCLYIEERPKQKSNARRALFLCGKCGIRTFEARINSIKNGYQKSCGCLRKEKAKIQGQKGLIDLTGQKFGKLTVIKRDTDYSGKDVKWICKCDCDNGTIKSIRGAHLVNKRIKSCGCLGRSSGEYTIECFLKDNNISFYKEYSFQDCVGLKNHLLRFDFYLPDYNCCIEYDGKQHFQECDRCSDSLAERQERDEIKNQYCKNNNIKLIRISYWDFDNIKNILFSSLLEKN